MHEEHPTAITGATTIPYEINLWNSFEKINSHPVMTAILFFIGMPKINWKLIR